MRARQRQYEIRDHLLERAKNEDDLRQARDAAEAANRAKDRFLATLSHELRTPLSPVLMTVSTLEADLDLPERVREDMSMMRNNIELETKLIDDLLDLNRVINGKLHLQLRLVSVRDLLRKVLQICSSDIHGKRLSAFANVWMPLRAFSEGRFSPASTNILEFAEERGEVYPGGWNH